MPWHDVHVMLLGPVAKDVAINFIERWNYSIIGYSQEYSMLFPMTYTPSNSLAQLRENFTVYNNCECQIVRSISSWSSGVIQTENSVATAYISAITNAKHYVMIINQYFISSIDRIKPVNRVLDAIYERLKLAITNKEQFRVIVLIPIWSAGNINSAATQYIMKYTYKTINRQRTSLWRKLSEDFPDVTISDYITIHSLRNYGILGNNLVYEQVYIHAKTMIVDDKFVLIGSANINDRSMLGDRDSELCCIIEHKDYINLNDDTDQIYEVSRFAHDMRMRLLRIYLGLSEAQENDFKILWSEKAYKEFRRISKSNTDAYDDIFRTPNRTETRQDLEKLHPSSAFRAGFDYNVATELLRTQIRGFLIDFPFHFLAKEHYKLSPSFTTPEFLVPTDVFL